MSLRRVIFCCLAVSTLAAGRCHASAAQAPAVRSSLDWLLPSLDDAARVPLQDTDAALQSIGESILDAGRFAAGAALPSGVKTLPAVPAAVVMTLVGFVCVSLARDRRAWLALACGLIWLGQASTATLPQLARRICSRTVRQTAQQADLVGPGRFVRRHSRKDQDLSYVALLRKLDGIPAPARRPMLLSQRNAAGLSNAQPTPRHAAVPAHVPFVPAFVLCPTRAVGDILSFSPAFIFSNLSRSPPLSA